MQFSACQTYLRQHTPAASCRGVFFRARMRRDTFLAASPYELSPSSLLKALKAASSVRSSLLRMTPMPCHTEMLPSLGAPSRIRVLLQDKEGQTT